MWSSAYTDIATDHWGEVQCTKNIVWNIFETIESKVGIFMPRNPWRHGHRGNWRLRLNMGVNTNRAKIKTFFWCASINKLLSSWIVRLLPRDAEAQYFIGKPQLMEFLCWFDYANRLAKECCVPEIVQHLAENIRVDLFEMSIEPMISILDISIVGFMLVLMAKIIRQIDAPAFSEGKIYRTSSKILTIQKMLSSS